MSHPHLGPQYLAVTSICQHTGETVVLGIFKDLEAVFHRLRGFPTSCGDEYRIECFHLQTAKHCAEQYNEQLVNGRKYQKEQAELKEKAAKYDELTEAQEKS